MAVEGLLHGPEEQPARVDDAAADRRDVQVQQRRDRRADRARPLRCGGRPPPRWDRPRGPRAAARRRRHPGPQQAASPAAAPSSRWLGRGRWPPNSPRRRRRSAVLGIGHHVADVAGVAQPPLSTRPLRMSPPPIPVDTTMPRALACPAAEPVQCSAIATQTASLCTRTGPLGQRSRSRAASGNSRHCGRLSGDTTPSGHAMGPAEPQPTPPRARPRRAPAPARRPPPPPTRAARRRPDRP